MATLIKNEISDYLSINVSEDEQLWSSSDSYKYGDERRDGHFIYKYAGEDNSNTEESPSENSLKQKPVWVNIGPTNYFAAIDGETSTQTKNDETLIFEISIKNYDSLALLTIDAIEAVIEMIDLSSDEIVYAETIDLIDDSEIIDDYTYMFNDFVASNAIYRRLPIYSNAKIKVTLNNPGSKAACGRLVSGRSFYMGATGKGVNLGLESYSKKDVNEFGYAKLKHRGAINVDSYEIITKTAKIPMLRRKAKELDAIPILYVMDESKDSNLEHLLNFGYWENFSVLVESKKDNESIISFSLKGIL
ncbi:hypothetical protein [Arcobacter roscoffensis]|uniref:Uncharacterized protein n=1 Tax=Arcobacter roscoffensis TaxID=2961520 RepID=A0ABY5DZL1_9BACT|nr:hypothetical protein [Arcobacter roscoffensis]UTJ05386.1 hypothetical protein NJU99_08905 [Arcobacter roscoffensis]